MVRRANPRAGSLRTSPARHSPIGLDGSRGSSAAAEFEVAPHALRRTCATLAGDLGQPPHVVSALLGHRSIGGGLHAGYNQSRYRAEIVDALQMVADLLDALAAGEDNIVAIRTRA